jgi:hypothetical protein
MLGFFVNFLTKLKMYFQFKNMDFSILFQAKGKLVDLLSPTVHDNCEKKELEKARELPDVHEDPLGIINCLENNEISSTIPIFQNQFFKFCTWTTMML